MADFNLVMPKLGESVQEATIIRWLVKPGDMIQEDDVLLEIATDKVDSEIPSPVAGKVLKVLFADNALVAVGEVIAVINTEGKGEISAAPVAAASRKEADATVVNVEEQGAVVGEGSVSNKSSITSDKDGSSRFYSPLVRSIASKENISAAELDTISGTGSNGRVRKQDVLNYMGNRSGQPAAQTQVAAKPAAETKVNITMMPGDEIVEMDRMRKMIADHMVMSKHTSPHVTNFVEADVTNLALWREKHKDEFLKREKIKLTFMPAFLEATAKALKEYPGVNASVDGSRIILRKSVHIGFAVALKIR